MPKYLKNKILYAEVVKCRSENKISPQLVKYFEILTENFMKMFNYRDIEDKKDCYQAAIVQLLSVWNKFNPDLSKNAFAYYTQIIKNEIAKQFNMLHPKKSKNDVSYDLHITNFVD